MNIIYQNFHCHKMYTNIRVPDSVVRNEDYAKRAVELGHGIISTMEHGSQGRYIEGYELAHKYNLKFVFGTEAYWVKDRLKEYPQIDTETGKNKIDKKTGEIKKYKDNTNAHICLFAKTENARQCLNDILSEANITGFYYRPRLDLELILSLPKDEIICTTACIAFWKYEDIDEIVLKLNNHFTHFYLEVQNHNTESQKIINSHIIKLSKEYNIPLIFGVDSHYILNEKAWERDEYLLSKGVFYEDEQGWYLDYPDGKTAYQRFLDQGVLSPEEIIQAMNNTNIFLEVEEYNSPIFNKEIKMVSLYKELSQKEKDNIYKSLITEKWNEIKRKIPKELHKKYIQEINKEVQDVITTKHSDYFLLNYKLVDEAIKKGGMITNSGRGSGVSYFTNKLLGFTKIDRISAKVKMYPERFISPTRIIESKSLADLDLNLGNPEVFAEAQREILGEEHSYPMIAYGTYKAKSAFKMYAKAKNINFDLANKISQQIEQYEIALKYAEDDEKEDIDIYDYVEEKYHSLIKDSEEYRGIVSDVKNHPCLTENTLILTKDGYKPIKDVKVGDLVLTHNNQYNIVTNIMNKKVSDYYNVKVGGQILEITENHPMYVISNNTKPDGKILNRTEPYWKPVENLEKGDLIGFAINQNSIIPDFKNVPIDNEDFWWLIGRYLGDGYCSSFKRQYGYNKRINIACHIKEVDDIILRLNNLNINYHLANKQCKSIEVGFYNHKIWDFLQHFGKYAEGKYLPHFVFDLPINLLKYMIDGYLSADGNITNNEQTFQTVSEQLAYGIQACIHKAYKKPCSIQVIQPSKGCIKGKIFTRRKAYKGRFTINPTNKVHHIYKDGYIWIRFNHKEKVKKYTTVYNLEVENDHSYTANNCIVHNCGYLIYQGNIRKEIGLIKVKSESTKKEKICTIMDGKWAEDYKFLKNDLLKVDVVKLIKLIYKRLDILEHDEQELIKECEGNQKVWDIYKNGWTMGINQCEKNATKHKVMKYQPKNISELCAFVAAIRPGFKSMYNKFEKREPFNYGIPTFDKLIQTPEMPNSFLLYQEMSMTALNFAGVPMAECYEVIKNISKKRIEPVKIYKEMFLKGFAKRLEEEENKTPEEAEELSNEVWQIINDSCNYQFNASHAYSVAIDSLYGAYLKSHYPLYFYEVFLNLLFEKGNSKDRITQAKQEAQKAFNIKTVPMRFGQDNRKFTLNEKTNSIYSALSSIKGIGNKIAEELYPLQDNNYNSFIDLLIDVRNNTKCDKSQRDSLIKLNYFEQWGNNKKLLLLHNYFEKYYNRKTINKNNINEEEISEELIKKYSYTTEKLKTYKDLDSISLLKELESIIPNESLSIAEQLNSQLEYLGYCDLTFLNLKYNIGYVLDVNTNSTPKIKIYHLQDGTEETYKIYKRNFKPQINKGDFIYIQDIEKKYKPIPLEYQNGKVTKWGHTDDIETIINSYKLINPEKLNNFLTKEDRSN